MENNTYKEYYLTKFQKDESSPFRRVKTNNLKKAIDDFVDEDTQKLQVIITRSWIPEEEAHKYNRIMGWEE